MHSVKIISLFLLAAISTQELAQAEQTLSTPQSVYAQAQSARKDVKRMLASDSDQESLRKGIAILERQLAVFESQSIHDWVQGEKSLEVGDTDIRTDLAKYYAKLGDANHTLDYLEALMQYFVPAKMDALLKDSSFDFVRNEARFKLLEAQVNQVHLLWTSPVIRSPYKAFLTVEERIAGLANFWAEVRANFVHFDKVPDLDWDQVFVDFLPRVMKAQSTEAYYRELMQLAPMLHDGHTNIYAPNELNSRFYSSPPLVTEMIEGHVLITRVASQSLASQIQVGDEVVTINDQSVIDYAKQYVEPFVSASTPQDQSVRMYNYQLFQGDEAQPIKLGLRNSAGQLREIEITRSGYSDFKRHQPFEFKIINDQVAYLSLDHFESNVVVKAFEQALPQIMQAKDLILDLRRNGGGSSAFAWEILSYLTDQPIPIARSTSRNDGGLARARTSNGELMALQGGLNRGVVETAQKQQFTGKVVVLTSAQTFSAAEDFLISFDSLKRGVIVGEPSGGSTGQPLFIKLPGGGWARICVKYDRYPNGKQVVGLGVQPQIFAHPTINDLRAGRDTVLETALAALKR